MPNVIVSLGYAISNRLAWGMLRLIEFMMTSSNGNIFRVTGHLCGEVTGEFPTQRPVTRSFDVFLDLRLNKRLSKQSWGWWFESLSRLLWRHRNVPDQDLYEEEQLGTCVLKAGIKDSEMWLHPTYTVGYNDLSHLWYLLLAHTPQLSFQPIMQIGNPLTDIYALMYTALQNLSSLSSYAWHLSVHLYLSTRVYTSGTWNTPPDVFSLTDKTRYRNIPQNPKAKILRIQVFVSFYKIGL